MIGVRSGVAWGLAFCVFLAAGGCGSKETGPKLVPVGGTIQLDGKAASGVMVTFVPTGKTPGEGGNGITDASGVYQLKGRDKKVGVPAGDYKIVCQKMVMPDGSDFDPSKGASLADSDAKQILPPVFSDREQTTLKASVPAEGGNKFDFDVKSK